MKPSLAENDMKKILIYRLPLMSSMSRFLRQNEPITTKEIGIYSLRGRRTKRKRVLLIGEPLKKLLILNICLVSTDYGTGFSPPLFPRSGQLLLH